MGTYTQINTEDGKVQAVSMWHPINGKWVLITQIFENETTRFYVDGVETFPEDMRGMK